MAVTLDVETWAQEQFGECELGDQRRTNRLVTFAVQAAQNPDASPPRQTEQWGDLNAAYRLFNEEDVTFAAVIAPHCAQTKEQMSSGVWLIINDTTELNFGYLRDIEGIGRVGSLKDRGFFLHTALAMRGDGKEFVGIAAQDLYKRPLEKIKRVSSAQRK